MRKCIKSIFILSFVVLLIVSVFATQSAYVYASEQSDTTQQKTPAYVRITTKNVYLYATPDQTRPLFALESTYYATVTGVEGEFYRVEIGSNNGNFCKILGYVLRNQVTDCTTSPVAPHYPQQTVTVTSSSAKIGLEPVPNSQTLLRATLTQTLCYYGSLIVSNTMYYYVGIADYLGYVESANVSRVNIASHPTPLSVPDPVTPDKDKVDQPGSGDDVPSGEQPQPDNDSNKFDPVQLALILLITIPSVVIVVVLFAPTTRNGNDKANRRERYPTVTARTGSDEKAKPRYFDDYL